MSSNRPPLLLLAVELLILVGSVMAVAAGVLYFWPVDGEDIPMMLMRILIGETGLFVYALAGYFLRPSWDEEKLYGWRLGPFRIDDPFSWEDDRERNRRSWALFLFPGMVIAGAFVHLMAWLAPE